MKNWLFRNTAIQRGRNISITPANSDFKFLSCGRIILDKGLPKASAKNEGAETTLLCLHGSGNVAIGGTSYDLARFDGIYIPRGMQFDISTEEYFDLAEASCPTEKIHPVQYVNYQKHIKDSESLTLHVGAEPYYRYN